MRGERRSVIVVGLAGALGCFLPWVEVPGYGSGLGLGGPGKLALASCMIAAVAAIEARRHLGLGPRRRRVIRAAGLVAALVCVWARLRPGDLAPGLTAEDAASVVGAAGGPAHATCAGPGWFVTLAAALGLLVGPWVLLAALRRPPRSGAPEARGP